MTNEAFGDKLKRLLAERQISQRQFAIKSGIEREYLNQIIKGKVKEPGILKRKAIAKGLGLTLDELEGNITNGLPKSNTKFSPVSSLEDVTSLLNRFIPVYGEIHESNEGMEANQAEPIEFIYTTINTKRDTLRAYRVKGLCLEPDVKEGDTVIIDTAITPNLNDLVVVFVDGLVSLKRFKGDYLENNHGNYRPEDVRLHGVVIEVHKRLR